MNIRTLGLVTLATMLVAGAALVSFAFSEARIELETCLDSWDIQNLLTVEVADVHFLDMPLDAKSGVVAIRYPHSWSELVEQVRRQSRGMSFRSNKKEIFASQGDLFIRLVENGNLIRVECTIR